MGDRREVEVFVPYDGVWAGGFELVGPDENDTTESGAPLFRLRRSDGSMLPRGLPADRIRDAGSARHPFDF